VAPIVIGEGAYVGAGSVITGCTRDALAVARGKQVIKGGLGEESAGAARGAENQGLGIRVQD